MLCVARHVSSRSQVYLIKQALAKQAAGTAKMIRMLNKYLPRALGTSVQNARSGSSLSVPTKFLSAPARGPISTIVKDLAREILRSIDRKVAIAPIAVSTTKGIHLRNKTPVNVLKDLKDPKRYSTPVSVAGHEGTHIAMSRPFSWRAWMLRRKLTAQAPKLLGSQYAGALAYQKTIPIVRRLWPSSSEIAADTGGKIFDQWLLKNNPQAYKTMDRTMKRLLAPRLEKSIELSESGLSFAPRSKQERMKQLLEDRNRRRATEIINRLGLDKG
jgi:hypothetical protein